MSFTARLRRFAQELKNRNARRHYVESYVKAGLPLQVRTMRQDREWNQTILAEKIGTTQNAVSRLESPRSNTPTIRTLLKIAKAFDVALVVRFMRFSDYAKLISSEHTESIAVPDFANDKGFNAPVFAMQSESNGLQTADFSTSEMNTAVKARNDIEEVYRTTNAYRFHTQPEISREVA